MGTTGLLAGPALIGFIAGHTDLTTGMAVVAVCAVLVAVCSRWAGWKPEPERTVPATAK
ncbi:hypothetical protein SHKM778_26410 [Streptomyces sp. KM77-8]|uniref:MFS transporter n=1 Tax=Streptomyces haneummycinicus TaxID=3074435 RepID=A0AAT9HG49_9ACTN